MKLLSVAVINITCMCLLTSCAEVTNYDLSSGFLIRLTTPSLTWESGGGSRELFYRGVNGKRRRVWEHVGAGYAGNGTAVFIGWREGTDIPRGDTYFAVKENSQVVAISKAVLASAAHKNGAQMEDYFKRYVEYKLRAKNNVVEFEFAAHGEQPDFVIELTWDEISEIVDEVIKIGKPHKDKVSGLTYLE